MSSASLGRRTSTAILRRRAWPISRPRAHSRGLVRALALAMLTMALVPVWATAPQERGAGPIRSGVSLVSIDFLALGKDGQPVPDLRADEVTLRIGGRARPVESINLIDVTAAGRARGPVSPLPAAFGTNVQSHDARSFVLVVDDDSFRVGTERALREAADTFLDNLAPTDRVALVTMPYGGTKVDLTTEQEKVRASLAQIIGSGFGE